MRQQVLYLWMNGASLDDATIAWAFHDGTQGNGPSLPASNTEHSPPYSNGVRALEDGWMMVQSSQLIPPAPGQEHVNSYLEYEFVFERRIEVS